MSALPPNLEHVRNAALAALGGIKPAGSPQGNDESHALMMASRTNGGRDLPPYYLVYFLLVDLLGFANLGQWEKVAWIVPIRYSGRLYSIEHRKMGLGIFAPTYKNDLQKIGQAIASGTPSDEAEQHAREMCVLIKKAITKAEPYFEWRAKQAAVGSKLNVTNNSSWLFERYEYIRDEYKRLDEEFERRKDERNITKYPNGGIMSVWPAYAIRRHAEWTGQAAIDAFFSWTEHAFIHIAILNGAVKTGEDVAALAEADWKAKFKAALPINDAEIKKRYETLLDLRAQIRNYMAHGAFGKRGQAFKFHSGAGAVPVLLTLRQQRRYTLTGKPDFAEKAALNEIDAFIRHVYTTGAAIALEHVQSGLASILTYATDGTYGRAMNTMEDMKEFIEYMNHQVDRSANMDW
ncbi:hypothetical protein [Metallibacterium scheffleri]|uniref:Uncharacterized protein n=1 Tax=Metallibacterium scheffleri TaxID=993689 RepID=A0A4S3KE61_9GAMM|nr:hypothetical protein [Metallibacterium scheffleri]THD06766.1 hypothetical protein B1806_15670 [Metallibacterium scheffleri]